MVYFPLKSSNPTVQEIHFIFSESIIFSSNSLPRMARLSCHFLSCLALLLFCLLHNVVSTPIFEEGPHFKKAKHHRRQTATATATASPTAAVHPIQSLLPAVRPGEPLSSQDNLKLTTGIELYYEGLRQGSTFLYPSSCVSNNLSPKAPLPLPPSRCPN